MASSSKKTKTKKTKKAARIVGRGFDFDGTWLPPKRKTRSDKGKPRKPKAEYATKKRHRRTKAELLKDPVYRKRHGLDDPKITDLGSVPKIKKGKASGKPTVSSVEKDGIARAYRAWEAVQAVINEMDASLASILRKSDPRPREFVSFDHAAGAMEDAFAAFERAIDTRGAQE